VAIARAFDSQVTLLRVLAPLSATSQIRPVDPLDWHFSKAEAKAYLDKLTVRLQEAGLRADNTLVEGQAAECIIEFVRSHDFNLIILSSHGQSGLSRWNVSSIVQKTILSAYVPTMIVRAYQPVTRDLAGLRYRRLLVPLDCSQRAECALPLATTLAPFYKSELLLVHVVSRPEMPRRAPPTRQEVELANRIMELNQLEATKYLEQLKSRLSLDVRTRLLVSDNAAATLHDLVDQENVNLVVLSAHGYSGGTRWPYGSMVVSFIAYGTSPLLIVQDLTPDEVERTQAEMAAREYKGH